MMNTLLNIYFKLPHDKTFGIVSKAFNRIVAKILKRILDRIVPNYFLKTQVQYPNGLNTNKRNKDVVVSFTSFPGRIQDVWIVVECLFRQTYKADKIILWLSKPQFEGVELPKLLVEQQKRGLEIRFVHEDLKSHKKYIYAFKEFQNEYIITVDDDLYYDEQLLENLVGLKNKFPDCVATNRAHKLHFSGGSILPYSKWYHNAFGEKPSHDLVLTGGFGTLYESKDLYKDVTNESLFLKLAPHADDLWLKIMVMLKDKKVVTNSKYNKDPISVKGTQKSKLVTENVLNGGNDIQFKNLLNQYKLSEHNFRSDV